MRLLLTKLKQMFPRSLLGEFLELFGEDATLKLIDVFSGTNIEVPSRRVLEALNRDISIYEVLRSVDGEKKRQLVAELANKYDLPTKKVREIYSRMEKQLKENRKFKLADELIGKLKDGQLKVKHEKRKR